MIAANPPSPAFELSGPQWFLRQFTFWSVFVLVVAAPSVFLARSLGEFSNPAAHAAMGLGILTQILVLALLTSTPWWRVASNRHIGRALRVTLMLRGAAALVGTLVLAVDYLGLADSFAIHRGGWIQVTLIPDMLSGMLAMQILSPGALNKSFAIPEGFAITYLLTLLTGLFQQVFVLCLTFVIWIYLRIEAWIKTLTANNSTA